MTPDPVPIGAAVRYGWDKVKERLGFWIVLQLIIAAISYAPQLISSGSQESSPSLFALINLIGAVLSVFVSIGTFVIALKVYDGQQPTYGDLFSRRNLFFRYLGGIIVYAIIVTIGFVLIVPGFIFMLTYQFTPYLIVDRGLGISDALKTSARLTAGVKWPLLMFAIVLIGVNILGVLALGVGLLISIPVSLMAGVYIYRHRLTQAGAAPAMAQPAPAT